MILGEFKICDWESVVIKWFAMDSIFVSIRICVAIRIQEKEKIIAVCCRIVLFAFINE